MSAIPLELSQRALSKTDSSLIEKATDLLQRPDLLSCINDDISVMSIVGEDDLRMMIFLVITSRMLNSPLAAIVRGDPSTGKSHIINYRGWNERTPVNGCHWIGCMI